MIEFISVEKDIIRREDILRVKGFKWGKLSIHFVLNYKKGYIKTSKGNKVVAYKCIEDSLKLSLYDRQADEIKDKPKEYFEKYQLDFTYNCFGYCFANGEVIIQNPEILIKDDYVEVEEDDAEIIVYMEYNGIDDYGKDIYTYSHAAIVIDSDLISYKPGDCTLIENADREEHTYNYNHEIYLKKRT